MNRANPVAMLTTANGISEPELPDALPVAASPSEGPAGRALGEAVLEDGAKALGDTLDGSG